MVDIYREVPDRRRECLFYLALGHFKLGNYNDARKFNEALLEFEPNNHQAHALRQEIEARVAKGKTKLPSFLPELPSLFFWCHGRTNPANGFFIFFANLIVEGYIGMAIVGTVAAVGTIILTSLLKKK